MSNFKDLTGIKFGKLTVIKRTNDHIQPNGRHRVMWLCKCDCGNMTITNGDSLKGGYSKSCGCFHKERARDCNLHHGLVYTRIYRIWCDVKTRCLNKNSPRYNDYGGRGITICKEWLNFETFYKDMGSEYKKHVMKYGEKNTSIDRIKLDKNYCKENCRWATLKQQANNKRNNHYIKINDSILTIAQASEKYNVSKSALHYRINNGWSIEKALTKPLKKKVN